MSSLQQRLTAVTDMQFAAIAAAAHLKSQLSELKGLRERVREALEFAATETRSVMPPAQVSIWKAPMKPASSEGPSPSPLRL
jgi:hypothetical protein